MLDWTKVTAEHVRQACALFDAGAVQPRRPAKSTFLLLDGKTYPAKFVRGLAHKLATGVDPGADDYSGGVESARFFERLGFATSAEAVGDDASAPSVEPPQPVAPTESRRARRVLEPQKQALFDLLASKFEVVECETKFPWLVVPCIKEMDESLTEIHRALGSMRGHENFAVAGQKLRCDFVVQSERLIVEYDERQHFTLQRAESLRLYPSDVDLQFDRTAWIEACESIRATDPLPPHRDEQRAFYDSLRDLLAARNGYRLVRFRQGTVDWTLEDAAAKLDEATSTKKQGSAVSRKNASSKAGEIKRVGLVSHDYNVADSRGFYDYSEHFTEINRICDEQGCDTILFALYTWDATSPTPRTHESIFGGLRNVRRIILEVGDPPEEHDQVEVWDWDCRQPTFVKQRFATSSASVAAKQEFIDELEDRRIENALLMICGETNIASLVRGSDDFYDPWNFLELLDAGPARVILNPIHDYMRRYEMREKRRRYSQNGRTVVSVWNQGKGSEAWLPWTVFHDGKERTEEVREIETPIPVRPDIRIGVVEV